jgi:hypothetical protein
MKLATPQLDQLRQLLAEDKMRAKRAGPTAEWDVADALAVVEKFLERLPDAPATTKKGSP